MGVSRGLIFLHRYQKIAKIIPLHVAGCCKAVLGTGSAAFVKLSHQSAWPRCEKYQMPCFRGFLYILSVAFY